MTTLTESINVTFAGLKQLGVVPRWARGFDTTRSTVADLCKSIVLPGISVVQLTGPKKVLEEEDLVSQLFQSVIKTSDRSSRIVLSFKNAERRDVLRLASVMAKHPGISGRIEIARHSDELEDTLLEATTKVIATRSEQDPLADINSIAANSRSLRGPSGRLDARKVAKVFGISLTELARQIGLTKQRISKTSDSAAVQPRLRPYERIARLRTVLSDEDFRVWLNTPNEHLEDGEAPVDYLKAGAADALAAFAENMLTGATT